MYKASHINTAVVITILAGIMVFPFTKANAQQLYKHKVPSYNNTTINPAYPSGSSIAFNNGVANEQYLHPSYRQTNNVAIADNDTQFYSNYGNVPEYGDDFSVHYPADNDQDYYYANKPPAAAQPQPHRRQQQQAYPYPTDNDYDYYHYRQPPTQYYPAPRVAQQPYAQPYAQQPYAQQPYANQAYPRDNDSDYYYSPNTGSRKSKRAEAYPMFFDE